MALVRANLRHPAQKELLNFNSSYFSDMIYQSSPRYIIQAQALVQMCREKMRIATSPS
jgi:hypothetical protein